MNHLKITDEPLDVGKIAHMASSESCGAVSIFVGTTRDSFEGKRVISLEYEAYRPMALKQLELICTDLRNRWQDIVNIVIFHRLGFVGIGEASVVIAISSPHRETSLNAVQVAIDDLKKRVPIWKKEIYDDEQSMWKENKESELINDQPKTFNENMCLVEDNGSLPKQLIQISVSEEEIKRRIQCFVEKKRNEIDLCNIMDFTDTKQNENAHQTNGEEIENNESKSLTCARVSSTVVKQEYSKCHLKVSEVKNNIGPQTSTNYLNTLDKLMGSIKKDKCEDAHFFPQEEDSRQIFQPLEEYNLCKHAAIRERLKNIEDHLSIPQDQAKNIYQRLKSIEDRLIFLESVSPEYGNFLVEKFLITNNSAGGANRNGVTQFERKTYSVNDIEKVIQKFEEGKQNHQDSTVTN